jgi:hypothetical protein
VSQWAGRGELIRHTKSGYAAAARLAGRGLAVVGLLPAQPPPREHRLRHWALSLTLAHDSLALADLDVPWWTYRAIDEVDRWLAVRPRPIRVFEYGSGASTLWLARRADEVCTVEHDANFAALMAPRLSAAGNVTVQVVPGVPMATPDVPSAKEGYGGRDFSAYVDAIVQAGEACLARALPHVRDDGLVVFDNSARRRYRSAISAARVSETRLRGLTPTLPYPEQTSLLRRR